MKIRRIGWLVFISLFVCFSLLAKERQGITQDGLSPAVTLSGKSTSYTMFIWGVFGGVPADAGFDGASVKVKIRCKKRFESINDPPWGSMRQADGTITPYTVSDTDGDGVIVIGPLFFPRCQVALDVSNAEVSTNLSFSVVGEHSEE